MVNISLSSKLMQFQCNSPRKRETSRYLPSPSARQLCCYKLVQSLPTGLGVLLLNNNYTEHEYWKRIPSAHAGSKQGYSVTKSGKRQDMNIVNPQTTKESSILAKMKLQLLYRLQLWLQSNLASEGRFIEIPNNRISPVF